MKTLKTLCCLVLIITNQAHSQTSDEARQAIIEERQAPLVTEKSLVREFRKNPFKAAQKYSGLTFVNATITGLTYNGYQIWCDLEEGGQACFSEKSPQIRKGRNVKIRATQIGWSSYSQTVTIYGKIVE